MATSGVIYRVGVVFKQIGGKYIIYFHFIILRFADRLIIIIMGGRMGASTAMETQ